MIFTETILKGAYVIQPERREDDRGFFARVWCRKEFEAHGLATALVQSSVSFNASMGTLRGMHFQVAPHEEAKLVRCTMGAIFDVMVDLRKDSATYLRHFGEVLSAENRNMFYIPEGFAHGFITLEDRTEVFYQMSAYYNAESARGVRWNDPSLGIRWPAEVRVISERDRNYPDFRV
jgi:dTDP-4-dehydrorhamnose 3,5-epimerase